MALVVDDHLAPIRQEQRQLTNRAYISVGYFLSQFVGYVVGLTLLTVGVFALTVYLSEFRRERWTLLAMVLSILGIGLLLSHYGLSTYALPVLGEAYLDGVQNAVVLADTIFGEPTQSVFYAAFLLYSAGFILFGFGVWGSGALPKWAGALSYSFEGVLDPNWDPLYAGKYSLVWALHVEGSRLHTGGEFLTVNGVTQNYYARLS